MHKKILVKIGDNCYNVYGILLNYGSEIEKMGFKAVSDAIYRLDIECGEILTSVFAFENRGHWFIMDFGVSDENAKEAIIPEIEASKINPEYLVCSHTHFDHRGGISAVSEHFPEAEIILFDKGFKLDGHKITYAEDGQMLFGRYKILNLKGHTEDGLGILDTESNVLVSGDALQMYGIGNYGTSIDNPTGYIDMLKRVRNINPRAVLSSHFYYPHGISAFGQEEVDNFINACLEAYMLQIDAVKKSKSRDPQVIAAKFRSCHPDLPVVDAWTFEHILKAIDAKLL